MGDKAKIYVIYSYIRRKMEGPAESRKSLLELLIDTVKKSRLDIRKRSQ